jgi:hypothetical protein
MLSPNVISRSTTAVQLQNLLHKLERRVSSSRAWGRESDDVVRQLGDLAAATWPAVGLQAVDFALKALHLLETAAERTEGGHRHFIAASDLVAMRLIQALEDCGEDAMVHIDGLFAWWAGARIVPPHHAARLIAYHAHPTLIEAAIRRAMLDRHRSAGRFSELTPGGPPTGTMGGPMRSREYALLLAELYTRLDRMDEALRVLEDEPGNDPRIFEATGDVLARCGREREAAERYRRAAVLNPEPSGVREKLLLLALARRDGDLILEQLVWLTERHEDLMYWHLLHDELRDADPSLLQTLRAGVRERSIGIYADILCHERDVPGVVALSAGKSFSFLHLWRMGEFLESHDRKAALGLYERALLLEGHSVQSRNQSNDFLERLRRVIPLFEEMGRATKPRRIAREILARQKNNLALKRELERLFDTPF